MADENKQLIADQNEKIADLTKLVQELSGKLEAVTAPAAAPKKEVKLVTPKTPFEVGGQKYKFVVPAYIVPGEGKVLAKDVLKNPAELERLVLVKSGVIALAK